jgi:hypothetical protein
VRRFVVVVGCAAVTLTGCSAGSISHSASHSAAPSHTPSASPSRSAAPVVLPKGYVRLADSSGLVVLGVPHTWFHARLDGSDPNLDRLKKANGRTGQRWQSFARAGSDGGVFAASDPLSADTVLLIERDTGVAVSDLGRLDQELRPELAKAGTIRGSDRITVDGQRGLRYRIDYHDNGLTVHEVLDVFDLDGVIVDFTFTGAAASIAAVTATIHFHSG